jgi:hypothetical protein
MSEYQYYEFVAVDRPLTKAEMADLRALSTRATITSTRFVNVYHWGNFKGNPKTLMEHYFDAFVYVANWGTNRFMVRLPRRLLAPDVAVRYCLAGWAEAHVAADHVTLDFRSENEEGGGWIEDEEAEGWMPALIPLRAELAGGDLRALYLGWLACAQAELLDEDAVEPPVPPGLSQPSAALSAFAEFLRIDDDLLAVAAERSGALQETRPAGDDLERWIRDLPSDEKDRLLLRVATGEGAHVQMELQRRFREAAAPSASLLADSGGRTIAGLLAAAEERANVRKRAEAARAAREREQREREQAAARAAYLDSLTGREDLVWTEVESLLETRRAAGYDRAVQLLQDLRDLSARRQDADGFQARLREFAGRLPPQSAMLRRLREARLLPG